MNPSAPPSSGRSHDARSGDTPGPLPRHASAPAQPVPAAPAPRRHCQTLVVVSIVRRATTSAVSAATRDQPPIARTVIAVYVRCPGERSPLANVLARKYTVTRRDGQPLGGSYEIVGAFITSATSSYRFPPSLHAVQGLPSGYVLPLTPSTISARQHTLVRTLISVSPCGPASLPRYLVDDARLLDASLVAEDTE